MSELKMTKPGDLIRHYKKIADGVSKRMAKETRKGTFPAAEVMALSALLSHAKQSMLDGGYSLKAVEAWVDVGDRYGEATRRGFASEGDMDAFHAAFEMGMGDE
jgi:hypothetical protein